MAVHNDQRPGATPAIQARDPIKTYPGEAQLAKVDDQTSSEI
jgi:hypothetical protein